MNETTPATVETPVEATNVPVEKKAKSKSKRFTIKSISGEPTKSQKEPKKAAKPKAEKKADARKVSGLRRFQVRTLKVLHESKDPVTVAGIAKRAKISHTMVVMGLGTIDPKLLKAHDKKMGFPSLITLGHVKVVEIEGITAIQITASGRKAFTSSLEALGGKLPKVKTAAA